MDQISAAVDAARDAALARMHDAQARDDAAYEAALDAALATVNSRREMRALFDGGDILDVYLPRGTYDDGGSLLRLLADVLADCGPGGSVNGRVCDIARRIAEHLAAQEVRK